MESNIELFERYIDNKLTPTEKQTFDARLSADKSFATDFRIYLFTVRGICQEAEQENIEFGQAMKRMSKEDLLRIIGRNQKRRTPDYNFLKGRIAWAASIAAILVIGIFSVLNVHQADMNRLDNIIVAYNYIPDTNRGWETVTSSDIPSLEEAYKSAPDDDVQSQQDAGMRLAMAYLKLHDRKRAKEMLTELSLRFADDEEFAAQCKKILEQLK